MTLDEVFKFGSWIIITALVVVNYIHVAVTRDLKRRISRLEKHTDIDAPYMK